MKKCESIIKGGAFSYAEDPLFGHDHSLDSHASRVTQVAPTLCYSIKKL